MIDSSPLNGWYALQNLLGSLDVIFSTLSQVLLLINLTILPTLSRSSSPSLGSATAAVTVGNTTTTGVDSTNIFVGNTSVANSIIVLVLCLAWPVVNRVLRRDLDGLCKLLSLMLEEHVLLTPAELQRMSHTSTILIMSARKRFTILPRTQATSGKLSAGRWRSTSDEVDYCYEPRGSVVDIFCLQSISKPGHCSVRFRTTIQLRSMRCAVHLSLPSRWAYWTIFL